MWWIGLASAQQPPPPAVDEMHVRFEALTAARDGVVQGDLTAARTSATTLLEPGGPMLTAPPEWRPFLTRLEGAARELEAAPDLKAAGASVAKVAAACAECHSALRGGPKLEHAEDIPPQAWAEGQNMPLHAWSVDWMWLGLLANDDEAWDRGARELDRMPLVPRFEDAPPGGMRELEQGVYVLAGRAREVDLPAERAELYGMLITTCSECHTKHRSGVTPGSASPAPGSASPAPAPTEPPAPPAPPPRKPKKESR